VDLADAERQMVEYRKALENHNIRRARQIINADETGLFFKALPTYTYVRSEDADEIRGSKNMAAKDRVTVQLMATADGVKGPTFVIGKQKKPRCFNGATLPGDVVYTNQSSAWMDRVTCQYWVDNVLTPWKRQILPGEKAVLIFDNAPAHIDLKFPDDSVVMLLPPNLTCIYQPMDQGIISAFKRLYKTAILDTVDGLLPNWTQVREDGAKKPDGYRGLKDGLCSEHDRRFGADICVLEQSQQGNCHQLLYQGQLYAVNPRQRNHEAYREGASETRCLCPHHYQHPRHSCPR